MNTDESKAFLTEADPAEDPLSTANAGPDVSTTGQPRSYLVELRAQGSDLTLNASQTFDSLPGIELDSTYEPIAMQEEDRSLDDFDVSRPDEVSTIVVRCLVSSETTASEIETLDNVVAVWDDPAIHPFVDLAPAVESDEVRPGPLAPAPCPYGTCDCNSGVPKGDAATMRRALGVDPVRAKGLTGAGIVVGVVDSGLTAQGRTVRSGETNRRIERVVDGWPTIDWGTRSEEGDHGNMVATDVQLVAPSTRLYDLRIFTPGRETISNAIAAFQWAIDRHRQDGTPHILTNSWGVRGDLGPNSYTRNPQHPFTRKVREAVRRGIVVLFAAGNCGDSCRQRAGNPCGNDVGPGKSIWGANGEPSVMTIGAVNTRRQFVGYSSSGPAALDPLKPDFCGITHFTGYTRSDSGTSAATPTIAGVVALLKEAKASARPADLKVALASSAVDLGTGGWDQYTGHGIVRADRALDLLQKRKTDRVRTGTQFRGQIAPKATTCFTTYGWPADWNVIWSVISATPRPGPPHLTWEVRVERSNNASITYWICVKNLTDRPIEVEGRYLVAG